MVGMGLIRLEQMYPLTLGKSTLSSIGHDDFFLHLVPLTHFFFVCYLLQQQTHIQTHTGANLGTTLTGIMSSLVANSVDAIQVALAHLFFNITGILIFYPIPVMRNIPMHAARQLGKATRAWKGFPFLYLILMFVLMPAALMGISYMFQGKTTAGIAVGSILVVLIVLGIAGFVY